jgi:tetratricopeptide (TPR) repeat protein
VSERDGWQPVLLREMVRAAASDGLDPIEANARLVPELGTKEVARSILVRLGRLGGGAKRLADAAAVLGGDATLRHAAELARLDRNNALDAWDALTRGEILNAGQPLEFIHPIARTAIYREIAPGERSRAHRHAAGILSRDRASDLRVAALALVCEPSGDQEVVAWLRVAAETALLEGAPDAAARYLRRAVTEPSGPENRPHLHFELGRALVGLDATEAAERFGEAAQGLDGLPRLDARRWQAYALGYADRLGDAMGAYDRAIDLAGPDTDVGLHLIGTRDFYGAWWGEAPDRDQRRLRIRELADDLDGSTTGRRQVLAADVVTAIHDGSTPATRAMRIVRRLERSELSWLDRQRDVTQGCAAFASIICDDAGAAGLFENTAIPDCRRRGRLLDLAFALSCLADYQVPARGAARRRIRRANRLGNNAGRRRVRGRFLLLVSGRADRDPDRARRARGGRRALRGNRTLIAPTANRALSLARDAAGRADARARPGRRGS